MCMWDECNATLLPHGVSVVQNCQVLRLRRRIYTTEEYVIGSEVWGGTGVHSKRGRVLLKKDRTKHANKRLWGQYGRKLCTQHTAEVPLSKIPKDTKPAKACIETFPVSLLPKDIKQLRRKVGNAIHAFHLLECKLTVHLFLSERLPWNSHQAIVHF